MPEPIITARTDPRDPPLVTSASVNGSVTLPIATLAPSVWLCGPIAPQIGPSRGGYETANRRTSTLLRGQGVAVCDLAYPDTLGIGRLRKFWRYHTAFARLRARLRASAEGTGTGSVGGASHLSPAPILHMTPLFRHFIWQEWRVIRAARRAGMRVVLDLRAGNKLQDHARLGPLYRAVVRACLSSADALCHEGQEQAADWQRLAKGKPMIWLPNFVQATERAWARPEREAGVIRLIHLGTVSPDKGVPDAIGVADALVAAGYRVRLDIVGRPVAGYGAVLRRAVATRPHVRAHGPLSATAARPLLDRASIFLFLTRWRGEGQSNALTEAMARGCVPVVTRHGFNLSVVGDCGLIVGDRHDHRAIAGRIAALGQGGDSGARHRHACRAIRIVEAQFTETAVLPVLARAYAAAQGNAGRRQDERRP